MPEAERRRSKRFPLQRPAMLKYNDGGVQELSGIAENACLEGTLIVASSFIAEGLPIEVTILLHKDGLPKVISLSSTGRVVRVEKRPVGYGIGVAYDAPLSEFI